MSVSVAGRLKPGSSIQVNEVGQVNLATAQVEMPIAGRAQFNNLRFPASTRNELADSDYNVNVNIFSGQRSSRDNILACDFFDGGISQIQPGFTLKYGLIGEYEPRSIQSANVSTPAVRSCPSNSVPALC